MRTSSLSHTHPRFISLARSLCNREARSTVLDCARLWQDRTIILTTHSMEEADILGDYYTNCYTNGSKLLHKWVLLVILKHSFCNFRCQIRKNLKEKCFPGLIADFADIADRTGPSSSPPTRWRRRTSSATVSPSWPRAACGETPNLQYEPASEPLHISVK